MDGSIRLSKQERNVFLTMYRRCNGRSSRRAHILLLLDDGYSWRTIREIAYASNDLIAAAIRDLTASREPSDMISSQSSKADPDWSADLIGWLKKTPQDFGYFRSRWSCETLAEVLAWEKGVRLSGETMRKTLHQLGYAWRRPRPTLKRIDPEYSTKLRKIKRLLKRLPQDHTAFFQDEVDINLNPKIGSCWTRVGQQSTVATPGNNMKRYLAGSIHWRTGRVVISEAGRRRNSELFIEHLDDLRRRFRSYRKIHVICDNAAFHGSRKVMEYLYRHRTRIEIHFLPAYAPETNPIERVWWHLHEVITRNHQSQTIQELIQLANEWFQQQPYFGLETSIYDTAA